MLLIVDIGNTGIKAGIFDNSFVKIFRLPSCSNSAEYDYKANLSKNIEGIRIDKCIIGTVSKEVCKNFVKACSELDIETLIIDSKSFVNLKIDVEKPESVGIDRLANVYALAGKYNKPVIVVDMGTAITFDIMLPESVFIGGIIMPGINTQLKSLNLFTSQLPQIDIEDSENAIGTSTQKAILSGILRGSASAIDGLISQCNEELGENAIIAGCGGQAELLSKYMKTKFDFINKNLTLEGLYKAYMANYEKVKLPLL